MTLFQQHQFEATITLPPARQPQWTRFYGGVLTALAQRIEGRITPLKVVAFYGDNMELVKVFIVNENTAFGRLGEDFYIDTPIFSHQRSQPRPSFERERAASAFAISMASREDGNDFEAWLVAASGGNNRFVDGHNSDMLVKSAFHHRDYLSRFPPTEEVALIPGRQVDRHVVLDEASEALFNRFNRTSAFFAGYKPKEENKKRKY